MSVAVHLAISLELADFVTLPIALDGNPSPKEIFSFKAAESAGTDIVASSDDKRSKAGSGQSSPKTLGTGTNMQKNKNR
jgi:hypothetical protein